MRPKSEVSLGCFLWLTCAQGCALLTFFFFTLKINLVFASIFGLVTAAAFTLSAAYWKVSQLDFDMALSLQKVSDTVFIINGSKGASDPLSRLEEH